MRTPIPGTLASRLAVGAGIDYGLNSRWSARLEYQYANLGLTGVPFAAAPSRYDSQFDRQSLRVGLNYHFGAPESDAEREALAENRSFGTWELHGQTTFIYQGYPAIRSPYSGTNSLPGAGQARETWTVSAFLGVRLWEGAELYFNPEFSRASASQIRSAPAAIPTARRKNPTFPIRATTPSRLFLRQTFGLGGPAEKIEANMASYPAKRTSRASPCRSASIAVHDLFDTNDLCQDPRVDFLNWSIWAAGAFDYPADRVGLTYGVDRRAQPGDWALRAGYFLVGNEPNAICFDMNVPRAADTWRSWNCASSLTIARRSSAWACG